MILGRIFQIILNEGVGVAADFKGGLGGSGVVTAALAGCLDAPCDEVLDFPTVHVDLENWYTDVGDTIMKKHSSRLQHASVGYQGQQGLYIEKKVGMQMWIDDYFVVDYYMSFHNPERPCTKHVTSPDDTAIPHEGKGRERRRGRES